MRITVAFALLNIAVTGVFTLVFKKEEDRVNSFVRKTGKIEERNKRAVLSQAEEMMVREEIFLESLASKLARRKNAISVGGSSELVPRLKSFLKTFKERPRLQTRGRNIVFLYIICFGASIRERERALCRNMTKTVTKCAIYTTFYMELKLTTFSKIPSMILKLAT